MGNCTDRRECIRRDIHGQGELQGVIITLRSCFYWVRSGTLSYVNLSDTPSASLSQYYLDMGAKSVCLDIDLSIVRILSLAWDVKCR
jgi:hypothetical protein